MTEIEHRIEHAVASLCHYLHAVCSGENYQRVTEAHVLHVALERARELKLIESPSNSGAHLDDRWVRLTPKGRSAVAESLCAIQEVA